MKRIVYTVALGKPRFAEMAMGLGRSLRLIGDTTKRVIVTNIPGYDWSRYFDEVLEPVGPRSALDKLTALERTDADQILALDVDMLAFKRLQPIFDYCSGHDFAIQGYWHGGSTFHGVKVSDICDRFQIDAIPRFNGGMVYYERKESYVKLLEAMRDVERNYADYGFEDFRGGVSEEVCILMAMIKTGRRDHIIPQEMQFQHSAAGLIGKLHLDVLKNECKYVCRQRYAEFYEPYIFHAWRYKDFFVYWRELDKLKMLEEYEDKHPSLYISRLHRLSRSIQRRFLRRKGLA